MEPDVIHDPFFLTEEESQELFDWIMQNVEWTQVQYPKYNKIIKTPRLTTCFGFHLDDIPDDFHGYKPKKIPQGLKSIKRKVEAFCATDFNYILMSLYRDGNDSISYHSDDERFLGKNPMIASLSLGETRRFHLKHKETKERHSYDLSNGSLMVMKGNTQHDWLHAVPKSKKLLGMRINLTFRKMVMPHGSKNYYHYNRGVPINV